MAEIKCPFGFSVCTEDCAIEDGGCTVKHIEDRFQDICHHFENLIAVLERIAEATEKPLTIEDTKKGWRASK